MYSTKRFITLTIGFMAVTIVANAQVTIKDAWKAIVKVVTYDDAHQPLHEGTGTFIDDKGTCVAPWSVLKGASSAIVTDSKGKTWEVQRIAGGNSNYDLVKFTTNANKVPGYMTTTQEATLPGQTLQLRHYTTNKKATELDVVVTKTDEYESYLYLHLAIANDSARVGLPLINQEGALAGFTQRGYGPKDTTICAIDARFIDKLTLSPLGALTSDMSDIHIAKAIPENESDALNYLNMIATADSATVITAANDFIAAHPDNAEGYVIRARKLSDLKHFAEADKDFATALAKAANGVSTMTLDEVHNALSSAIFQKSVYAAYVPYEPWTLDRAADEAAAAYAIKAAPFYMLQIGRCRFANKQYDEAYKAFMQITKPVADTAGVGDWSDIARAECWFYAARALEQGGGDSLQVIAHIDSCLEVCPKPLNASTAQYVLERAQRLQAAGLYRQSALDYIQYEALVGTRNLQPQFFYIREQVELEAKMYQQALDDIRTAIARAPKVSLFRVEEAYVLLRTSQNEACVKACEALLKEDDQNMAAYRLMGLAYINMNQKAKGAAYLKKAEELGDATAAAYLERYQ